MDNKEFLKVLEEKIKMLEVEKQQINEKIYKLKKEKYKFLTSNRG